MSTISGVGFGGTQDRNASYAFLTPLGSSRTTLFISVHLPTEKNGEGERLRVAVASGLRPWADGLIAGSGLRGVDIVIGGDFNSYQRRQPNGAQQVLANSGMIDGFAAPVKVNANYSTVNYTPKTRKYKASRPGPTSTAGTRPGSTTSSPRWHPTATRSSSASPATARSTTATARRTTTW
jgi:hypothetical protein